MRIPLKEQIGRRLQSILGYCIGGTTLLFFGLALGGVVFVHHKQLEQYEALISTKLSSELAALVRELDLLGNFSVVQTGLTDSARFETHLTPLLAGLNQNESRQIHLLDYQGRDDVGSSKTVQGVRLSSEVLNRVIDGAVMQAELQNSPRGARLLLALPVTAPSSNGVRGILLTHTYLDQALKNLSLPSDLRVSYSLDDRKEAGPWTGLSRSSALPIRVGAAETQLRLNVDQPLGRWLPWVLLLAVFLLGGGYALFRALRKWAQNSTQAMTDRIDRLMQAASMAASQKDVHVEQDTVGDEISTIFDAMQSIVLRQRVMNQQLCICSRVFETAAEAILISDRQGCITDVNDAFLRITGYAREELMGKPASSLYFPAETRQKHGSIADALRTQGEWQGEAFFLTHTQEKIPVMMAVSPLACDSADLSGHLAVASDIRDIKRVQARLSDLLHQDQLTGLLNYSAFMAFLEEKLRQDAIRGQRRRFALLFVDLDYFKHINDNYGHELGDQVIIQFAQYLKSHLPEPNFLCRRSGDEFIAVLDIDESSETIEHCMKKALPSFNLRVRLAADRHDTVSFSVGAVAYPEHAANTKDLLVLADSALLFAKEAGRARLTWLDTKMIAGIQRRHLLENKLKDAVRERLIDPYYQPEVDMRTGAVTGFEALARWTDAELGPISPAEFIPIAEEHDLIDAITEVMLQKLMVDLPQIRARFAGAKVAFNSSPKLLSDQRIFQMLRNHLTPLPAAQSGLAADISKVRAAAGADLIMEVTESDLMQSVADASAQIEAIMGLGVQIAIDDFGTGYSSLSRLAYLPIHKLKIDRSFVVALDNEGNTKVVRAIMALAQTLQLDVTAEGVETPFQREALLDLGCHRAQGFLFARPMPISQLLQLPSCLPLAGKVGP